MKCLKKLRFATALFSGMSRIQGKPCDGKGYDSLLIIQ
jgi:hypothetical protein